MSLELFYGERSGSHPWAVMVSSVRSMSEGMRVARQSCLPVSCQAVFRGERVCQEASGAEEALRSTEDGFLCWAHEYADVQMTHQVYKQLNLTPTLWGSPGIYFCLENGSAEWVSHLSSTHDCFYKLWHTLHGECLLSYPFLSFLFSFLPSHSFYFSFLTILLWTILNLHKHREDCVWNLHGFTTSLNSYEPMTNPVSSIFPRTPHFQNYLEAKTRHLQITSSGNVSWSISKRLIKNNNTTPLAQLKTNNTIP